MKKTLIILMMLLTTLTNATETATTAEEKVIKVKKGDIVPFDAVLLPYDIFLELYSKATAYDKLDFDLISENLDGITNNSHDILNSSKNIDKELKELKKIYYSNMATTIAITTTITILVCVFSGILLYQAYN